MASILLQARGAGLGATFGGDSSVYRSRRGIEKRLFQFTVVLAVLFVIFSLVGFKLRRLSRDSGRSADCGRQGRPC